MGEVHEKDYRTFLKHSEEYLQCSVTAMCVGNGYEFQEVWKSRWHWQTESYSVKKDFFRETFKQKVQLLIIHLKGKQAFIETNFSSKNLSRRKM